jgi:hypothetical protein
MASQVRSVFWHPNWQSWFDMRCQRVKTYETIKTKSLELAADERIGLLVSHLPIPHLGGLYDRSSGQFGPATESSTNWGEQYLGNLVLVDRVLGEFRTRMSSAGLWDKSSIIITSDHWLRNSTANGGKTDYRVPLLIKMPKPTQGVAYSSSVNNLLLYEFSLAVLRGEVTNSADVVRWMDENRSKIPVDAYVWSLPATGKGSPKPGLF